MHFSSVGVDTENIHNYEKGHPRAISVTINRMQCCLHVAVSWASIYNKAHCIHFEQNIIRGIMAGGHDEKDLMSIGQHCNYAGCHQLDFLPFKCKKCSGIYW